MSDTKTHFRPKYGQLLNSGRYQVLRKLGEGTTSQTWLVRDSEGSGMYDKFAAAKILSTEDTAEPQGPPREREFLQAMAIPDATPPGSIPEGRLYLPSLTDSFVIEEKHLCLVTHLYSTSIAALQRSAPFRRLPIYMARSFIYMTVSALQGLHGRGIVHTDVQSANLLFVNTRFPADFQLEEYLREVPAKADPEGHLPESQPLPHEWEHDSRAHEAERMTVVLTDLGSAEWIGKESMTGTFCPLALRPPEVILDAGFGPAIDIWTVGCLYFELISGSSLFAPESGGPNWNTDDDHLAKMQELTGKRFPTAVLDCAKRRNEFFDSNGNLIRISERVPVTIENALAIYNTGIKEADIQESADFIRMCLELDHTKRPTAEQLLQHGLMGKAFACEC